jgi:hypothetical protein
MTQTITAYDKFRDIGWMAFLNEGNDNECVGTGGYSIAYTNALLCNHQVVADDYWAARSQAVPELLSVLKEFRFYPVKFETGLTYCSGVRQTFEISNIEQEFELQVKMSPKARRNITLKIEARSKGTPKPILL